MIAGGIQITAAIVAANIVAVGGDCADIIIENTVSSRADVEYRVRYGHDDWSVEVLDLHPIIVHGSVIDASCDRTAIVVNTKAVVADAGGNLGAESTEHGRLVNHNRPMGLLQRLEDGRHVEW